MMGHSKILFETHNVKTDVTKRLLLNGFYLLDQDWIDSHSVPLREQRTKVRSTVSPKGFQERDYVCNKVTKDTRFACVLRFYLFWKGMPRESDRYCSRSIPQG